MLNGYWKAEMTGGDSKLGMWRGSGGSWYGGQRSIDSVLYIWSRWLTRYLCGRLTDNRHVIANQLTGPSLGLTPTKELCDEVQDSRLSDRPPVLRGTEERLVGSTIEWRWRV